MTTISLINTKGGVGKTVTAVHLGAALARMNKRVLLIDVDLQHGLSRYFHLDSEGVTTTNVLLDGAALGAAALTVRKNLSVVPANSSMERAEVELAAASGGEVRLRRAMRGLRESEAFDFCLIDCPSGWGAVTRNALLASDAMIVPVNCEPAAVDCATATEHAARELGEHHDQDVLLLGVLLTRWRATNAARAIDGHVARSWGKDVFDVRIRQAEKINELAIRGETSSDVSVSAAGVVGEDHERLAKEVIARCRKIKTK